MEEDMKKKCFWTVTPVMTGRFGMVRDDIKYQGGDPCICGYVPSVLFLLESGEQQVIVDTGFGNAEECAHSLNLVVEREKSYESILEQAGVVPDRVKAVIFTHLHWDHAGNAASFPCGDFYCHKTEWERAQGYPEEYPDVWLKYLRENPARIKLVTSQDVKEILPGIYVRHMGGHTHGSMMVLTDTVSGLEIIAGDVVMTEKNIQEDIPVGLCVNRVQCEKALEIIKGYRPVKVYPSHDFGIFGKE